MVNIIGGRYIVGDCSGNYSAERGRGQEEDYDGAA